MPVSSIAQILLRLFALNAFLTGVIQISSVAFQYGRRSNYFYSLGPSLVYLVGSAVIWFVAPGLSRLLAKRNDGEFTLAGVTEQQLFSTAFLSLGLYFALTSFGNVFNWIHFFATSKSPEFRFLQETGPSFYALTEGLLTLAAGVTLMLTARTWAAKLCRGTISEPGVTDQPAVAPESKPE